MMTPIPIQPPPSPPFGQAHVILIVWNRPQMSIGLIELLELPFDLTVNWNLNAFLAIQ